MKLKEKKCVHLYRLRCMCYDAIAIDQGRTQLNIEYKCITTEGWNKRRCVESDSETG